MSRIWAPPLIHVDNKEENENKDSEFVKIWEKLISEWDPCNRRIVKFARSLTKHGPIPISLRSKAWFVISGATELLRSNPGLYEKLYLLESENIDLINKDCPRTNIKASEQCLQRILTAYSTFDVSLGYCQGMNYIAAFLLNIFGNDNEEQVFWTFVVILRQIRSIFIEGLPGFKKCAYYFGILCKYHLPKLHNKWIQYELLGIDIYKLILTPWFYSLFSYPPCLHYEYTARIWDIFLIHDFSIFIKIAFIIIETNKHKLIKMDFVDIVDFLKYLPFIKNGGEQLIKKAISIKLNNKYIPRDLTKFDWQINRDKKLRKEYHRYLKKKKKKKKKQLIVKNINDADDKKENMKLNGSNNNDELKAVLQAITPITVSITGSLQTSFQYIMNLKY